MFKKVIRSLTPMGFRKFIRKKFDVFTWIISGMPSPPPYKIKRNIIRNYQKKLKINIFIETGTFLGDTIYALRTQFRSIYSIELSEELYNMAIERFQKFEKIKILHGDSGKILPELMKEISESSIFWLDGHYCDGITAMGDKSCPIIEELQSIVSNKYNHLILIDDARLYNGVNSYPTISELMIYLNQLNVKYSFRIKNDIIRIQLLSE